MSNRRIAQNRPVHGGNLAWAAALADCPPSSILDFSASINPLGPPSTAIAAIQEHLTRLSAYPSPDYAALRQALAAFHSIDPEWILPGNGAAELLTWIGRDLAATAGTVMVVPGFSDYWRALRAYDATVFPYALSVAELFAELFERAQGYASSQRSLEATSASLDKLIRFAHDQLQGLSSRGALLLNNPHNPTGLLWSAEAIASCCEQFALVVVDEAFMDFLPPETQQSLIRSIEIYPNLVILRSLTKFYSVPGLRLGYAIAHPDYLKRWQAWRDPWPVNALAEAVAIAVLSDVPFQQQTLTWLQKTRPPLLQALSDLKPLLPYPGSANFLLVQSQVFVPALQEALLKKHHILIRDCLSFQGLGDRYFRIAVRTESDNQRLLQALREALASLL